MVQKKIVLKVVMENPKERSKALQIVARFIGVVSVSFDGNKITVVSDGVDAVALTIELGKKFCTELIYLAPVEAKKEEKKEAKKEQNKEEKKVKDAKKEEKKVKESKKEGKKVEKAAN